jgi:hypothetical protein
MPAVSFPYGKEVLTCTIPGDRFSGYGERVAFPVNIQVLRTTFS